MTRVTIAVLCCVLTISLGHAAGGVSVADYRSIKDAIAANPGRTLYVPPGDYTISEQIRLNTDNSGLVGPGRIIQTNPDVPIIQIERAANVQVRDLTLTRPEGKMDTKAEGLLSLNCTNLVVANLQVIDNRTRSAAIALRECVSCDVRDCFIHNYMTISVDDRTGNKELYGYAFNCIDGSGISLGACRQAMVRGNRIIETHLLPTREVQKQYDLGRVIKRIAEKPPGTREENWKAEYVENWHQGSAIVVTSPEVADHTQIIGNSIENAAQGIDIHADHVIVAQNIVNNAFIGMKAMHGSRQVLVLGNQFCRIDLWGVLLTPGSASHLAVPAQDGRPARVTNLDGGSIIAHNIFSDLGYGNAYWIWGAVDHSRCAILLESARTPGGPKLRDVVIEGNVVYDPGPDEVLVDGKPTKLPPRYKYAVIVTPPGPEGLHFANNILAPGADGVCNVEMTP